METFILSSQTIASILSIGEWVVDLITKNSIPFTIGGVLMLIIGIAGQWKLYTKCGLPGIACLVPVWNVITFLKIVGRPAKDFWYFLIPGYNIYFTIKIYIELCQAFGKNKTSDYVMCIILNGFYVLNLGLSYSEAYVGPGGVKTAELVEKERIEKEIEKQKLAMINKRRQERLAIKKKRLAMEGN